MATASCPAFKCVHCDSHCFSCGQTRPHTAGKALVSFRVFAASRNSPRSMFLMNLGILIPTGQPFMQVGLGAIQTTLGFRYGLFFVQSQVYFFFTAMRTVFCIQLIHLDTRNGHAFFGFHRFAQLCTPRGITSIKFLGRFASFRVVCLYPVYEFLPFQSL